MAKVNCGRQNSSGKNQFATPYHQIKHELSSLIAPSLLTFIPKKWEKIGDVLILKLPAELQEKETIAEVYARVLNSRTVMEDVGGISGVKREPDLYFLYGDENTETVHLENGINFKLDVSKIMFSSGNIDERIRMATISSPDEIVVDFFSGIGYFTIPMAVYCSPHIFACELNPIAYKYLLENIKLNQVEDQVTCLLGDCREVAPRHVADRIVMGYFESYDFLPYALKVLKRKGGIIHFHELSPTKLLSQYPLERFDKVAHEYNRSAEILHYHKIKSYNPLFSHVVIDIHFF
jgi:tRNA wybutosine-synthesizing protein 2